MKWRGVADLSGGLVKLTGASLTPLHQLSHFHFLSCQCCLQLTDVVLSHRRMESHNNIQGTSVYTLPLSGPKLLQLQALSLPLVLYISAPTARESKIHFAIVYV